MYISYVLIFVKFIKKINLIFHFSHVVFFNILVVLPYFYFYVNHENTIFVIYILKIFWYCHIIKSSALQSWLVKFRWLISITLVTLIKLDHPHGCHICHMSNIMLVLIILFFLAKMEVLSFDFNYWNRHR
jgi:hypothetical protein